MIVKYVAIFSLILIGMWVLWAAFVYRYSDARVSGIILSRINDLENVKDEKDKSLGEDEHYLVSNIVIGDDKVKFVLFKRKKDTQSLVSYEDMEFDIVDCALYSMNCISL